MPKPIKSKTILDDLTTKRNKSERSSTHDSSDPFLDQALGIYKFPNLEKYLESLKDKKN
ncbi:MAG: hypothetical protein SGI71_01485 [Verrucomicrobiota bacterium]|nr:hypothetical protein [Verrucomicrobiota bacterium]